jgi:hypothetical protein
MHLMRFMGDRALADPLNETAFSRRRAFETPVFGRRRAEIGVHLHEIAWLAVQTAKFSAMIAVKFVSTMEH